MAQGDRNSVNRTSTPGADGFGFKLVMKDQKIDVYTSLRDAIQYLELKPGSPILDSQLVDLMGVSRTPIREALIRLSDEKLIDIYPQRGTYVSKINLDLANQMAYLRHVIETEILSKLCSERADVSSVTEEPCFFMKRAIDQGDAIGYIKNDSNFHAALFGHAGHSAVWDVISSTRVQYIRLLMLDMALPNRMEWSYKDHLRIVELIRTGDWEELAPLLERHHDYDSLIYSEEFRDQFSEYFTPSRPRGASR